MINAGSSSIKSRLYAASQVSSHNPPTLWQGQVNFHPDKPSELIVSRAGGKPETCHFQGRDVGAGFGELFNVLSGNSLPANRPKPVIGEVEIKAVGHRVVHGGDKYFASTRIDQQVLADLHQYIELAPSHEQANITGMQIASDHFPKVPQVAVFDTAFHHTMPPSAFVYAGPYSWFAQDEIRRYGFHGISHSYCGQRAAALVGKDLKALRIITCHLGNGCSLCAIKNGASLMTTMGFTPLEGLVMGTRSGSLDPGILLHLLKNKRYSVDDLSRVLNKESGLKGLSGLSGDMRELEAAVANNNSQAKLAWDVFVHSLSANICALIPRLGGLDILVFAGGIGENSALVRFDTCSQLDFIGVKIDQALNQAVQKDTDISSAQASVRTLVIHTNEELAIARECLPFIKS